MNVQMRYIHVYTQNIYNSFTWGFGGTIVGASAFHLDLSSWVRFSLRLMHDSDDTYVKRVSQRSTESRGFSPSTLVSSHREC